MSRQRTVRIGNVRVASATVARMSPRFARRTLSTRSRALTPCSAQASSPSVNPSPTTHAQRDAAARLGASGAVGIRLEGEGNEVADFVDEGAERVAGRLPRRGPQLLGARQRAVAAVQQAADVDHRRLWSRGGRDGRNGRPRAGEQLVQRRGADPAARQPLIYGPGPDQVGGLGHRLVGARRRRSGRSEEHTSELQSPCNLVCRLLLEKKKKIKQARSSYKNNKINTKH